MANMLWHLKGREKLRKQETTGLEKNMVTLILDLLNKRRLPNCLVDSQMGAVCVYGDSECTGLTPHQIDKKRLEPVGSSPCYFTAASNRKQITWT